MECFCDYETPEFYRKSMPRAAKGHCCDECGAPIKPGDVYERISGKWDGVFGGFKTCSQCVKIREWVAAHVPCVCWAHGNMIPDLCDAIDAYLHEAPGLKFGFMRRLVQINRSGGNVRYQTN
jgi:hypothetical protein